MTSWISKLGEELKKPLPGEAAQLRMSPAMRRPVSADLPLRNGGVMLLLYPRDRQWHVVFIRRPEYDGVHSDQVSFPGGMYEERDEVLVNTALRETMEEIGLSLTAVTVIGKLTPLHIPVSNVNVHAFVGFMDGTPEFRPDPAEVRYLIEVSLDDLMDDSHRKSRVMRIQDRDIQVPYFDIQGNVIWGATAMILSEFLEVAGRVTGDWF